MIETYRGVVYPQHLDQMGHMNVQWYIAKFDEATWHLMSALGLTWAYMQASNQGMAALEQNIRYKAEARSGDLLVVRSKALEVKNKTIRFLHVMYDAESGKELASAEMVGVHMDLELRKSCALPAFVKHRAEELFKIGA